MNKLFAVTLAGLLLSGVSLSVAYADDSSSKEDASYSKDNSGEKDQKDGGSIQKTDLFSINFGKVGDTKSEAGYNLKFSGVETFAELKPGQQDFKTAFGTDGEIVGVYNNVSIKAMSLSGDGKEGEDGKPSDPKGFVNFALATPQSPYSLTLYSKDSLGLDYIGFYMPKADSNATLSFYKGGVLVGTVTGDQLNKGFDNGGEDSSKGNDSGRFIDIYDKTGSFDMVKFSDGKEGGAFETENHTIGYFDNGSHSAGAVPEPAAWTMMILGVGLIGGALRRRRSGVAASAAA